MFPMLTPKAGTQSGRRAEAVSTLANKAQAIRIHQTGGPEVMRFEEIALAPPGSGEVRLRHSAIGLNFIDVYGRTGLYVMPLPGVLGREAAGVVEALGPKVRGLRKGDRVAYVDSKPGSYCTQRNVAAGLLVKLPRSISDEIAAAVMLKGLTAHYLLRRSYRVQRGDWIVVHAAAGGDRKSTRLNSSHGGISRMPSSA